jgi:epoxyqueuosine reductase
MSFDLGKFATCQGWALAGACDPKIPESTKTLYQKWLREYKPADQMKYLERREQERLQPELYFKEVKSALCFGFFYFPGWAAGELKVSNYAWSEDYHLFLKKKLEATVFALKKEIGDFQYRLCVDTSPVLEKTLAVQAGLGWQGKNTLLLHPQFGSYLFLAEILTDIPLHLFEAKLPISDHCGKCTRCIDACPTNALEPYTLHPERCISYLTLEHKGDFPAETPPYSEWIAGCDICQEVCPWNQKLIPTGGEANLRFQNLTRATVESPDWLSEIQPTALSYVPKENWERNLKWVTSTEAKKNEAECN